MKIFFALIVSSFLFLDVVGQQTIAADNMLLGYQEFPTSIQGHTADNSGNQYYTGVFRGQLTVNKQVLATGNGLEDIFWVKTNAAGQVLQHKTFGSANTEGGYINNLAMGSNNQMLFGLYTMQNLTLGATTLIPYPSPSGNSFTAGLVCMDTAGTVLWSKRTNLQNFKIYYSNNIYHVFGSVVSFMPTPKYGDATILDSIGKPAIVHLMIDGSGNLLGAKTILVNKLNHGVALYNVAFFSDNSLLLQLRIDGDTSYQLNKTVMPLPLQLSTYHLLVRTDTSYTAVKTKILNPLRHSIAGAGNQFFSTCVGPGDSVYTIFNFENTATPFSLDGFSQTPLKNTLYAMDGSLTVRRQVFLNNSNAGTVPSILRRRIFFRHMAYKNGFLFMNGYFTGSNESPINAIPTKDTTVTILPGLPVTFDLNGASKSFMAKCDLAGNSGAVNWYGSHSPYENANVTPAFLHNAGPQSLAFVQLNDNVWNPWTIEENLKVVTGSMRKGTDMSEVPCRIQYFADGSRVIIGYARGKTALDTSSTFITHNARRDIFLVRLRANNEVVWYKRFHSTLYSCDIRGFEVKNGRVFFLANYLGSQNDSNYIKVGNDLYNVRVNASLMASIDTAGNLRVHNLSNPMLRTVFLMNFSFFTNGDLALATDVNPIAYKSFPTTFGPQIFRLDVATGSIIDGRKLFGASTMSIYSVRVNGNDQLYLSGASNHTVTTKIYLHNGVATADSLQVPATTQLQQTVLKTGWNGFHWLKRFSGNAQLSQNGDIALVNGTPVLGIYSNTSPQPLLWDGQTVHSGFGVQSFSVLKLNDDGSIAQKKSILNVVPGYMREGKNSQLHLSFGLRAATNIDTIQVGFGGGGIDGLAVVIDSNLVAKKSFRVSSSFSEIMYDMDIFQDSIIALTYSAQTNPQLYMARTSVASGDYEEDAFVGTFTTRNSITTSINTPLPTANHIAITPNPVTNKNLQFSIAVTQPVRSVFSIYQSGGKFLKSQVIELSPSTRYYNIALPDATARGVYFVTVSNFKFTTTRTFIVL